MPPIIGDTNTELPVLPIVQPIVVTPEKYKGVTVDTKHIPASALLTHVEGSSWTVNYYSQVLTADSALSGQQVTKNAVYQQYKLIKNLELKVTGPLVTNQDTVTKSMNVTGNANVFGFVIPNVGDVFLADIGDGNEGIFRITLSERKSVFKDTIHAIEYLLVDYSTVERRGDLNSKIVDTVVFVRDFLEYGQNPLIHEKDLAIVESLIAYYHKLSKKYFETFTSNEYKTLLIPGQAHPIYDHFVTKTMMSMFTTLDINEVRSIRILNVDDDDVMKSTTIWDMLKARDKTLFKYCNRFAGLVAARSFTKNPMMEGIYHSGINYVVYPVDPMFSVDNQITYIAKAVDSNALVDSPSPIRDLSDLVSDTEFQGLTLPANPIIKKVLVDDYYVFSKEFYTKDLVNMSLLELCVMDYLDGKAPNNVALLALCNTSHSWGKLENFFYLPVLFILLKASVRFV